MATFKRSLSLGLLAVNPLRDRSPTSSRIIKDYSVLQIINVKFIYSFLLPGKLVEDGLTEAHVTYSSRTVEEELVLQGIDSLII